MAGFDNNTMYADNVDFTGNANPAPTVSTNGQLLIGSTAAPKIRVGTLTSPNSTIDIGYSSPDITLDLVGGHEAIQRIVVDTATGTGTNPVVPLLGIIAMTGAQVATGTVGTNVIRTDSTVPNSLTIEIQRSTAVAATDVTKNGVSHFDSTDFSVDVNGFVTLNGSGAGQTITGNTGGALPPTAGNWNIFGATAVAGTTPVITDGSGSTLTIHVQTSQALAASDVTKIGLSNFNSSNFTVDANGFVSSTTSGGMPWTDVTSATQALSVHNGYFTDRSGGVTYTLPATAALGDIIKIDGKLGITTVAQNANQQIRMSSALTTVGVSGSIVGTNVGDCVTLRCSTAGASTIWIAENFVGNWTVN